MPAGVPLGVYVKFFAAALVCMAVGSQAVHQVYLPLSDLDDYVDREVNSLSPELQESVRAKLSSMRNRMAGRSDERS